MERATVGIAGLGLIGASIGQGLMSGFASRVVGYDPSEKARAAAGGCVDQTVDSLSDLSECELVVLAAPPSEVPSLLAQTAYLVSESCAVTDVASVKALVTCVTPEALASRFIPGHPMAGHESSGSAYARADMFQGAKWVVCPPPDADASALQAVLGMVRHLRALPVMMSVEEHDAHTALLSHLPHLLASALLTESVSLSRPDIAGGSWRDVTRVGGANPELWADILIANKGDVLQALGGLNESLSEYRYALKESDRERIVELFCAARTVKEQ